jgi:HAD superfamily hydrolase (TIGR01509 family)
VDAGRTGGGSPSESAPRDLDGLTARWRLALDAAGEALQSARRAEAQLRIDPRELAEHHHRLTVERHDVGRLIDELARERGMTLRRRLEAPRPTRQMLGLPADVLACVFDLDGVLAASDAVHAAAWGETFDQLLARRLDRTGERFAPFRPFDPRTDYPHHIQGRPRLDGVRAFLSSRGIRLPDGRPQDPPDAETVHGLANFKRDALVRRLETGGVTAFDGSRSYLEAARDAGLRCAVVSASSHTKEFLEHAGLDGLVPLRVDGETIRGERLGAKPAPDTVSAACRLLGVAPADAAAFETTPAGVDACRAAGIGYVVGVERTGGEADVHEADVVVDDLAALLDPALTG